MVAVAALLVLLSGEISEAENGCKKYRAELCPLFGCELWG
jgi:hypothetical protein